MANWALFQDVQDLIFHLFCDGLAQEYPADIRANLDQGHIQVPRPLCRLLQYYPNVYEAITRTVITLYSDFWEDELSAPCGTSLFYLQDLLFQSTVTHSTPLSFLFSRVGESWKNYYALSEPGDLELLHEDLAPDTISSLVLSLEDGVRRSARTSAMPPDNVAIVMTNGREVVLISCILGYWTPVLANSRLAQFKR